MLLDEMLGHPPRGKEPVLHEPDRQIKLSQTRDKLIEQMCRYARAYCDRIDAIDAKQSPSKQPPIGFVATVGLGKSCAVSEIARILESYNLPLLVVVPTHELADEYCDRLEYAHHYFGRQPELSKYKGKRPHPGQKYVCQAVEDSHRAGNNNHRPAQSLCKTCPHGMSGVLKNISDPARVETARRFFKIKELEADKFDPCHFLYEGLPESMSRRVLVMPSSSFSEAASILSVKNDSGKTINQIPRLVIFDEATPASRQVKISPAEISTWVDSLTGLKDSLVNRIAHIDDQFSPTKDEAQERVQKIEQLKLLPEVEAMFTGLQNSIINNTPLECDKIIDLDKRTRKAGGAKGGTFRWERVSLTEHSFSIPLRALGVLSVNLKAHSLTREKNAIQVYEILPSVEWAINNGSTIFLDATMSLATKSLILAAGGEIIDAQVPQNMQVTRFAGHLYARGMVRSESYPRAAAQYIKELERVADQLPEGPRAIITHKAYKKYSDPNLDADAAAIRFAEKTGVPLGHFGAHDRGHNQYDGHHIAIVGMPLQSPATILAGYSGDRAALLSAGVEWPLFDQQFDDGSDSNGVPLPIQKSVREWLLDGYAATQAQAVGRARAINSKFTIQIQLWGGLQMPEMDDALLVHGVRIDEVRQNDVHRTLEQYRERGTDVSVIDRAIDRVIAIGKTPSQRTIRSALDDLQVSASARAIRARLSELRTSGVLPAAAIGRPNVEVARIVKQITTEPRKVPEESEALCI